MNLNDFEWLGGALFVIEGNDRRPATYEEIRSYYQLQEEQDNKDDQTGPDTYGRGPVNYGEAQTSKGSADSLEREGYGSGGFEYFESKTPISYENAMQKLYSIRNAAGGENPSKEAVDRYKTFTKNLKKYTNTNYKSGAGEKSAFEMLLKDAQAGANSAIQLLNGAFGSEGLGGPSGNGNGNGRGGGYSGPVASTTLMNKADLKSTANAVASAVLGRGITDEEFQKVLKQVRTAERSNPSISTPGVGSNVTQQGLSTEGRQNIIRDSLMKGPEAEDYGKATKMMGVFAKALEMRSDGS